MTKIPYVEKRFRGLSLVIIAQAEEIITEYLAAGFTLTLRQLYYQFVARGLLRNLQSEYKRLGGIINDARLAGLIDWEAIEDRTRNLVELSHWEDPAAIIEAAANSFRLDLWEGQDNRLEVWIEKDALVGVIEPVCTDLDIPYFSCRGYTSQSEMWGAAMRLIGWARKGYNPIILHLGDHDPSGIDMSRDIRERLALFFRYHGQPAPEVIRIALTMEQVEELNPPPNPAKVTDSRFEAYLEEYGSQSWELDALDPRYLDALIRGETETLLDRPAFDGRVLEQEGERDLLQAASENWAEISEGLE